jgi:hypothetical protein
MKINIGFIELKSVPDYWKKLNFDYTELKSNDNDIYVAFNFFVTAYHMIDWVFEGKYSKERIDLNSKPIMKVCNHIVSGIKHFEPDSKRHNSVLDIEKERYVEEDYIENGYFEDPIIIHLDEKLESEFGKSIKVMKLAKRVMCFWDAELNNRNLL